MKKHLLITVLTAFTFLGMAQTATDFKVNDCEGIERSLFAQLNDGKVIILCWVMPCGACVSASLTTYNVVQSYQTSNPDKVFMYLIDDYANTDCVSLNSWANSNNLTKTTRFSNTAINMTNYGSTGMPKIVVLGGNSHKVFYNANNTVTATNIQNAINSALVVSGVIETNNVISTYSVVPNPAVNSMEVKLNLTKPTETELTLYNTEGQLLQNVYTGTLFGGENTLPINVANYAAGIYLLKISEANISKYIKVVIAH